MKKYISIILLTIVLFAFSTVRAEGRWQWITSNDKFGQYFDTQTIHFEQPNIINVWIKDEYPYPTNLGVSTYIVHTKYDIKNLTSLNYYLIAYNKNGETLKSGPLNDYWEPIIPDSIADTSMKVCTNYLLALNHQ